MNRNFLSLPWERSKLALRECWVRTSLTLRTTSPNSVKNDVDLSRGRGGRRLPVLGALCLLSACMLVRDFGPVWGEAKADPCLNKIAESLYYSEFRRNPEDKNIENLARGYTHGDAHYLLMKQNEDDRGGRLYRFRVHRGIFQRYRLNPTMRETFEHDYPEAPVDLSRDTITFETLGEKELALLDTIAAQENYWEIEDQTLYNVLMNPACRFEDRDLSQYDSTGVEKKKP